ncbi:HesA/MoeB/ThiF family protein [Ferruginibacter lapsinanis]|uniref:HesA/MoeB/ThiF family protein n=1 Tax=Ferruginibacter lapsinanis TaxID=563172 RepID=UPI001E32CC4D|nr:HesA/MoeB/ThiF family protein [Ferruginibacter lapsinanis]UEG50117.1 HesA/MoeB/ThiF family protein [Ferruginibacter lapsinanis]
MEFNHRQYYQSHQKLALIGDKGQQLLQRASILVIGAGGLGCPSLLYLAGAGIGTIGIVDFDLIAISNLHRQVLYTIDDVGKRKAFVAAERLSAYNAGVIFKTHDLFVDETNILSLVNEYDVIVDCTDNFQVRYLINDACVFLDKPLVYGAIHQTEGHITVFNYKQSPTLRCLFPNENNEGVQSCADIGAYNIITGIIGTMMANEGIKIILDHPDVLAGKLCQFDSLTVTTRQIKYQPSLISRKISTDRFNQLPLSIEISPTTLSEKITNNEKFYLIDVREANERKMFNIGGSHIPFQALIEQTIFPFSSSDTIIIYCEMGSRSLQAARHLLSKGFTNVFSLQGGMSRWKRTNLPK